MFPTMDGVVVEVNNVGSGVEACRGYSVGYEVTFSPVGLCAVRVAVDPVGVAGAAYRANFARIEDQRRTYGPVDALVEVRRFVGVVESCGCSVRSVGRVYRVVSKYMVQLVGGHEIPVGVGAYLRGLDCVVRVGDTDCDDASGDESLSV